MRDEHPELATLVDFIEHNDGSLACKGGLWTIHVGPLSYTLCGSKLTEDACRRAREGIVAAALAAIKAAK